MSNPESLEVGELVGRVASRWRVAAAVTVAVVAAAVGLALRWPLSYDATALLAVSPTTVNPFASTGTQQQVDIDTERVVAGSPEVAIRAAALMGGSLTPQAVQQSVRILVPEDSQTLQVTYSAGTPERAAEGANSVAAAYLAFRVESAKEVAAEVSRNLDARIAQLSNELPTDPDAAISALTIAVQQQIVALREQQSALASTAIAPGRVIGSATPPESPSSPGLPIFVAAGLALGLLAGVALAVLRDTTDWHVRNSRRLAAVSGTTVVDGIRDPDRQEPFRRTLFALGLPPAARQSDGPVVTVVLAADRGMSAAIADSLATAATDMNLQVTLHRSDLDMLRAIDRGWPDREARQGWGDNDLVVIDGSALGSGARRSALALRADSVAVVVFPRSALADVEELATEVRDIAGKTEWVALFLPPMWQTVVGSAPAMSHETRQLKREPRVITTRRPAAEPDASTAPVAAAASAAPDDDVLAPPQRSGAPAASPVHRRTGERPRDDRTDSDDEVRAEARSEAERARQQA